MNWVKKKDLFGCFVMEEIRSDDNKTGLKQGEGIKIENLQVLSIYANARSFAFE